MKEPKTYLSQPRILATPEFIEKNQLKLKSQEEILSKMTSIQEDDLFGFRAGVLIDFLSFESAKPFLADEYVVKIESKNEEWSQVTDIQEAAQYFLDYMNFAWGKAEGERGLSASRSIEKLSVWLWVMGREDLHEIIQDEDLYNPYGAPALITVCEKMGVAVPESLVEFSKTKQ